MRKLGRTVLFSAAFCLLSLAANGQQPAELRAQLFAAADAAMAAANDAQASVLAPASYEQAAERYRRAEENLARGRSIEDIREDLGEAVRYFEQATENTELARVGLSEPYQARQDALAADALTFAEAQWREAELTFADAVRRLEAGNMNRERNSEAVQEYRAAELAAIENNYLSGARQLIEQARDQRVNRYAPKTFARAESLLADAETRLRNDRYDTDLPRSLARESNYEARHSMYLASRIEAANDGDITDEDLLLEAEAAFAQIAGTLDQVVELDTGFAAPTAVILERIQSLQQDRETLAQREDRVAFLEEELARLESQLGEESERRQVQEQVQQRFEQLAAVFTRQEAQVLRREDEIIVRMGLNFDVGSSVIKPEYFPLLRKIQTAIDVFPNSQVEVQGHTDSFGADETNLRLSEQRASAVQQYLMANMDDLGSTTITAAGYGETVPLANNETTEGRLRNRRIDLLITPDLDALAATLRAQ
jgi:OOP family OmpA-OmpF porin